MAVKNGLDKNIPGTLINGTALASPCPVKSSKHKRQQETSAEQLE